MTPKRTSYQKGYIIELRAKDDLKKLGANLVIRSSRSRTPADLIAFFPDTKEIWLVQVKGYREAPRDLSKLKEKFKDLAQFKGQYTVKTKVFIKRKGRYTFIEV
ncbi:MAG: hypothetical protein DRP01_01655 [Archaeoglobales archaeon]|nr:MAG: hypothetical protein DRP01_01655 [Archaeoglobales archaeon]